VAAASAPRPEGPATRRSSPSRRGLLLGTASLTGMVTLGRSASAAEPYAVTRLPIRRQVLTSRRSVLTIWTGQTTWRSNVLIYPSLARMGPDFDHLVSQLVATGHRALVIEPLLVDSAVSPEFTLHDLVADAEALLDRAGIEMVHALGHAFGSRVIRLLSVAHAERVLTTTCLACGGRVTRPPEVTEALINSFNLSLTDEERLEAIDLAFFADGNDPSVWLDGWFPAVARAEATAVRNTPEEEFFLGGPQPMLIVQGEQDTVAPKQNALILRDERTPPTTLRMLANSGHALLPEQPEEIARAVGDFLRVHDGARAPR
jgi:pimeloyl-ACP methyl ester carboxylesterase